MPKFNYQKISSELISKLSERQKEIIVSRFGLKGHEQETLEAIGQKFGICRERIRQIQNTALEKIKPETEKYQEVFDYFRDYLKDFGGLKREKILLEEVGGGDQASEVSFLLGLQESFKLIGENNNFYSLWTINNDSLSLAEKVINSILKQLESVKKPLVLEKLKNPLAVEKKAFISHLQISKKIQKNDENLYGLSEWPEINPRGIKDKAYLIFKKQSRPLHFKEAAKLLEGSHVQTVHNELIKDSRFVLVGRGIYALAEWGYYPGQVKEVISKILEGSEQPLSKEEILKKVLEQRIIKKNTVLLNLSNKQYFSKNSEDRYTIKEA